MVRRLSQKEFIKRCNKIHNYKYNYSKTFYKNKRSNVYIICPIHGEFIQNAERHMIGHGCIKCGIIKRSITRINKKDFINEAKKIYGNKYDYSISKYTGVKSKIDIICLDHGVFTVLAGNHLSGNSGCNKCAIKMRPQNCPMPISQFKNKANKIHNYKYNYSNSKYKNLHCKIKIICPNHGLFIQAAYSHLNGHGCPQCGNFISKPESEWLDSLNIKERNVWIKLSNRNIKVDGFDPKTNTIYEFYGDYWHGNPKKYNHKDLNKSNNKTFGKLYNDTIKREHMIKENGFNLVSIWESDWKKKL